MKVHSYLHAGNVSVSHSVGSDFTVDWNIDNAAQAAPHN